jgi:outer membrane lipoprotein-sorting protein
MRKRFITVLTVGFLLAGASWASAQDDAKALLDKAVKAHGGPDKLNKIKAQQSKAKGSVETPIGKVEFAQESSFQYPDKFKEVSHANVNGMQIDVTTVYNGKEGWMNVMGQSMPLEGNILEAIKDSIDTIALARLAFTGSKDYEASPLGEAKVNDRPSVGVKISRKGHKDVNLYFDKETGLLSKLEHRVKDPMSGQDLDEERIVTEYQDVDGMKVAKKATINREGKKYMDVEVTDLKFLDKLPDGEFEKP